MSVNAPNNNLGFNAPEFYLLSTDGRSYSLNDLKGVNGTVIAFICNHCPYVVKIAKRLAFEALELKKIGVSMISIMSNDVNISPDDSYENMIKFSKKNNFHFPYLYDSTQEIAYKYNAVCTPDIFGFDKLLELKYRGRIDSGVMGDINKDIKRDLFYAMEMIVNTNKGPKDQFNSFGCSIKWMNNE